MGVETQQQCADPTGSRAGNRPADQVQYGDRQTACKHRGHAGRYQTVADSRMKTETSQVKYGARP